MGIVCILLTVYELILLVYVVLSWVPRPPEPILPLVRGVRAVVDPVLQPLRRLIPPAQMGGVALDLSIIVLFIAIFLVQSVVCR